MGEQDVDDENGSDSGGQEPNLEANPSAASQQKVVKIFWQRNCPKCPSAKELGKKLEDDGAIVEYFDTQTVDGLAEASFFDVLSTPSVVLAEGNKELAAWRGEAPKITDVKKFLRE
jgi:hypothetical protein